MDITIRTEEVEQHLKRGKATLMAVLVCYKGKLNSKELEIYELLSTDPQISEIYNEYIKPNK